MRRVFASVTGWLRSRAVRRAAVATLLVALGGWAAAWAVPLPERLAAEHSTVVEYRDGSFAHVFLSPDDKWRVPIDLDELDPAYVDALLALEDERFRWHPGVDPIAVARALGTNLLSGRRVSGASTITMQLVRVLEPRPRTYGSKLVEALRALQLELRLSKREILTAYLQLVPYGRNVEGVESASLAYFGHRATALSAAEIATLLAVPQNPNRRYPTEGNVERLRIARDGIAARLAAVGALPAGAGDVRVSGEEILRVVRETVPPAEMRTFPRSAPHAAVWLRGQRRPGETRVRTTLDRGMQSLAERTLRAAAVESARKGIHNASAVIVDHRTGDVVALVGNFDFWDGEHGGQISGFAVPRSPGSALKPFLYAMAVEKGIAGPHHLVLDVPVTYGSYSPKNYDGTFNGLVTLEDALSRSLNLPFVNLLQEIGIEPFLGSLRGMGVASLVPDPGFYGLSAVVGGIELTPLEIAALYSTLAADGEYRPLRWRRDEPESEPSRVFSEGATYLTQRALAIKDRPDFPSRRRFRGMPAEIHWKTGTSFGNRDAWAAGSGPAYTAVVWMGNFDNTATSELVGSEAAGPVLFDLLEGVADRARLALRDRTPRDLMSVEVCAYSGHLPTRACTDRLSALARRTAVPTRTCPYHVAVDVDVKTGQALSPTCRGGRAWETRTFTVWPATVRRWLKDQHRRLPEPPVYAPGCEPGGARVAPLIVSPADGQVAMLIEGVNPADQEVPFEAESAAPEARLSWFVNGELVGTVRADERLWWIPTPGSHEILVADESGQSSKRRFEVRHRLQ